MQLGMHSGIVELSAALEAGMTPVISYWESNDMLEMDGDSKGSCARDKLSACAASVHFSSFKIEDIEGYKKESIMLDDHDESVIRTQANDDQNKDTLEEALDLLAGTQTAPLIAAAPGLAAPGPTAAETSALSGRCSAAYGRCGGRGWTGPTCCAAGFHCLHYAKYWSQCQPVAAGLGVAALGHFMRKSTGDRAVIAEVSWWQWHAVGIALVASGALFVTAGVGCVADARRRAGPVPHVTSSGAPAASPLSDSQRTLSRRTPRELRMSLTTRWPVERTEELAKPRVGSV